MDMISGHLVVTIDSFFMPFKLPAQLTFSVTKDWSPFLFCVWYYFL